MKLKPAVLMCCGEKVKFKYPNDTAKYGYCKKCLREYRLEEI